MTDMLMIPEYPMWKFCGVKAREYINATTMGMINTQTGEFDEQIIDCLCYPKQLFPKLSQPGTLLGNLRPEILPLLAGTARLSCVQLTTPALR